MDSFFGSSHVSWTIRSLETRFHTRNARWSQTHLWWKFRRWGFRPSANGNWWWDVDAVARRKMIVHFNKIDIGAEIKILPWSIREPSMLKYSHSAIIQAPSTHHSDIMQVSFTQQPNIIQASSRHHSDITHASFRCHPGIIDTQFWHHSGAIQTSPTHHSGHAQASFSYHSGSIQASSS